MYSVLNHFAFFYRQKNKEIKVRRQIYRDCEGDLRNPLLPNRQKYRDGRELRQRRGCRPNHRLLRQTGDLPHQKRCLCKVKFYYNKIFVRMS